MIDRTKASRRLGIVGAAAAVGIVPISVLATPAFAAAGPATLSLANNAAGVSTTATDTFTTTQAGANQLTIADMLVSPATGGTGETLPANVPNTAVPPTSTNYTVSYTTTAGGTATTDGVTAVVVGGTNPPTAPGTPATATLTLASAIPTGAAVTVTIAGITNGSASSVVQFGNTDTNTTTSTSGSQVLTNTVTIAPAPPVTAPGVTSVNPTAFRTALGEPFTITGTNFAPGTGTGGITGNPPVVCFVPAGTAAPTPSGSGGTATTNCANVATLTSVRAGQIQGASPALAAGTYNVVVYNWNPAANSSAGGYTAASGTTSQTLVGASSGLNFVPESGVRIVDSRVGTSIPKAALTPGTPVAIPLSNFAQSPAMPTNLPAVGSYTGLDVNVTAVAPASGGNIQMWTQTGAACPNGISSTGAATEPATVNFQPPQDTNNSQVIPVTGDTLCVQDNGAAVNLVVDLDGYTTGVTYVAPAAANRIVDTRNGTGTTTTKLLGPLSSGTVYRFVATDSTGTPLVAGTQVALNVADVAPTSQGYLTVFPEPAAGAPTSASGVPNTAVTNFIPGTDSSAMVVTTVGANGYMDVYSGGTGKYNLVVDQLGTFAGSSLKTLPQPFRIYDSRPGPIAAGSTVTVTGSPSGSGSNFVPSGALGLMGNLSDINPTGQGYLSTFPAGGVVPGTASIAHFPMQTRNTNNVVALNPTNGAFSIYAGGAATNTTFDATAYIS